MAQELLTTFESTIGEVALMPGKTGVFKVMVNDGKRKYRTFK
jgi:predicted Rdx family selenoprotein